MEDNNLKETPRDRSFFKGLVVGLLIGLAFILGFFGARGLLIKKTTDKVLSDATEEKLAVLSGLIHTYYYKDVDDEKLSDGVLKGLVEGLGDPYSAYYTKEEYEQQLINTNGNYAGIGAVLSQDKDTMQVSIVKIYEGSPAEKAKLLVGDIIVSADEYIGTSMELSDFVQHIRGEKGSVVSLKIKRGDELLDYDVTRDEVTIQSVYYQMLDDEIGYILIGDFSLNTENEFKDAIADLKSLGMKAVIYDVRSNTGGLVESVTDMLDDILPEGTTLYMMDKKGKKTNFDSDEETKEELPTVVLTDGATASAAEIFAGAIRDFKYGTLIGTKTYGKGVVQRPFPLSDGSAIKLTTESYYTPNGECIHEKGIEPDIELEYKYTGTGTGTEYEYDKDNQVQKAIEVLKKELGQGTK